MVKLASLETNGFISFIVPELVSSKKIGTDLDHFMRRGGGGIVFRTIETITFVGIYGESYHSGSLRCRISAIHYDPNRIVSVHHESINDWVSAIQVAFLRRTPCGVGLCGVHHRQPK